MWTRSHSVITKQVTKEQIWKLFANVDTWHTWDKGIEYARLEGKFEKGSTIILKPVDAPKVKIEILETTPYLRFWDVTKFPLAKLYDDHIFEETKDGLKITITITVTGILGFVWRKIVAEKLVAQLPVDMLEQIKAASGL